MAAFGRSFPSGGPPNIQFVGSKAVNTGGGTSNVTILLSGLTGGLASSPAAGDLVIVADAVAANTTGAYSHVITSGYSEHVAINASNTYRSALTIASKTMGSTPDTDVVVGPSGQSYYEQGIVILVFRNVSASTPMDVTPTTATGTATKAANPPAITPITAGSFVVAFGSAGADAKFNAGYTSSDLTNFTTINSDQTGSYDGCIGGGYATWTSGAFDPAVFGGHGAYSPASWCGATIALRPA